MWYPSVTLKVVRSQKKSPIGVRLVNRPGTNRIYKLVTDNRPGPPLPNRNKIWPDSLYNFTPVGTRFIFSYSFRH